jgi:hypothetical protein
MLAIAMLLTASLLLLGAPLAYACGIGDPGSGSSSSGSSSGRGSNSTGDTSGRDSSGGSSNSTGDTSGSDSSSGSSGAESEQQLPAQPPNAQKPLGAAAPVAPQDPGRDFVPPAPAVPPDPGEDFVPPQVTAAVSPPPVAAPVSAPSPAPAAVSSGESPTTDFEVRARGGLTVVIGIVALSYQQVEVQNLQGGKSRKMSYFGIGVGFGIGFSMVTRSDPVPYSTARPATTADFGGFAGAGGRSSFTHWQYSDGGDLESNLGPSGSKKVVVPRNSSGAELTAGDATLGRWW